MQLTITRTQALVAATALVCLLGVSVAVAGPGSQGPDASLSASVKKKIKKLNGKVKAQASRIEALEAEQGDSRPPSGPSGGDLSGQFPNPSIAGNAVTAAKIATDAVDAAELNHVDFLNTETARLTDAAGGGSAGQTLFTIGRVGLSAFCANNGAGEMTAGISPIIDENAAAPRPVMVTDAFSGGGDDDVVLDPFSADFFDIVTATSVAAHQASFAILDSQGTSASGVVAVSVNPANESCVLTAQAFG